MFLYASLFRQIRNPDNGLTPPDLEFFKFYQHLKTSTPWPDAAAGDPAGINVASSMGSLIYGVDGPGIKSESENLDAVPLAIPGYSTIPQTPREHWVLAKYQRGAIDIATGARAAPMLDAGDQFHQLYQGPNSKHGNSFGGFLPGPEPQTACDDLSVPLAHLFTFTDSGMVISGTTTCSIYAPDTTSSQTKTNVKYVYETETSIFIVRIDGSVVVFDRQKVMQGPYTTATTLRKTSAKMIDRVLAMHASEYRGTDAQREASEGVLLNAFDFQSFFSSQYLLAPARGVIAGESISSDYPVFSTDFTGGRPAGHVLQRGASGGYPVTSECVIACCLVDVVGFFDSVFQLEFLEDGAVTETATVACDSNGTGSGVIKFRNPVEAGSIFSVRLASAIRPQNSGSVTVEVAELQNYKPRIFDAYAFLRLAGFREGGETDGSGTLETGAANIFQRYQTNGNCTNATGLVAVPAAPAAINQSGIFETARQLSKVVRIIPRQNLISYEVAGGKSILVFKRNVFGVGFSDAFDGLIDIVHTAPKTGWTNQWLMGVEFKTASSFGNNTSIFRPEVYADYFTINNRCVFFSYALRSGQNSTLRKHVVSSAGSDAQGNLLGEAPSSFNYAKTDAGNLNSISCTTLDCETKRKNFYKSCRIYEPWPEVESVEAFAVDGEERVRITFKTRLRSTSGESGGALDTIDPNVAGYTDAVINAIKNEPFRTDENGILEYLILQSKGVNCCVTKASFPVYVDQVGNRALDAPNGPSGTFGTCFPDFIFVKLIPTPYEDGNTLQNADDSPVDFSREVQKEIYLRAICEGFVDAKATTDNCGSEHGLYAFSYETLNYQAHGKAWPTLLQSTDRTDAPRGFWPLPNTIMRAAKFNEFSKAINLLDRVPLMMPFLLEGSTTLRNGGVELTSVGWPFGSSPAVTCALTSIDSRALLSPVSAIELTSGTASAFAPINLGVNQSLGAQSSLSNVGCGGTNTNAWQNLASSTQLEVQAKLSEPDQKFALPPSIEDMVVGFKTSFVAQISRNEAYLLKRSVSVDTDAANCGPTRFFKDGTGFAFDSKGDPEETFCVEYQGGAKLDPTTFTPPNGKPAFFPRGDSFFQGDTNQACALGWAAYLNVKFYGGNSDMFLQIPLE